MEEFSATLSSSPSPASSGQLMSGIRGPATSSFERSVYFWIFSTYYLMMYYLS